MPSFIVDSLALAYTLADREMLEDLMRAGWKRGAICECYWVCALPKGINLYIPSYFWESRTSDYPVQVDHNPERCWNFWMKRLDFGCEVDLILI